MDIDLSPLLSDLTAVAAVVVVLFLAFRAVKPFIDKAADSMAKMSDGYVAYVQAQADIATAMRELRQEVREDRAEKKERDEAQDDLLQMLVERVQEMGDTQRGFQQQMVSFEGRAQKRHEQQMEQAAKRHEQALAQGEEMLKALRAVNGKH